MARVLRPSRSLENAICAPFGDQLGEYSDTPGVLVRFTRRVPSGFITQISSVFDSAILLPSGDHAGPSSRALSLVRRVCPEPSAFITYRSYGSSLSLTNTIRCPSGDHTGSMSSDTQMFGLLVKRVGADPSAFIT